MWSLNDKCYTNEFWELWQEKVKGFWEWLGFCLLLKFGKSDNFSNSPYSNKPWSSGLFLHVPLFPAHSSVRLSICTYVNWSIRASSYTTVWSVSYQGPRTESLSSGCHFGLSVLYLSILLSLSRSGRGLADTKLTENFPLTLFSWVSFSKHNRKQLLTRETRTVFVT